MTGLPGAIPIQTSGSGSPGCIPFVASAPGTPGSLPADVASPGDPGAVPIQTSGTGSPGLIPVEGIPIPIPTAGLLRGWDPNSVTGSDISTVPAGFGTTAALTTTSTVDVRSAFSPALNNMLQTTAANSEKGTFTATTALSAFTLAFIYAPSALSGTTPVPIIGNSGTTTQSYVQFNTSSGQIFRVELRPDSGTAASINLSTGQLMNLGASYLVIITYDGATVTIYVNGVAVTGAKTGSFTFNQLYSTKGAFADGFWGKMALWNRVLTAPELAIVGGSTAFGTDISTGFYISPIGSDSPAYGFSAASALANISTAVAKTQIVTNTLAIGNLNYFLDAGNGDLVGQTYGGTASGAGASNRTIIGPYNGTTAVLTAVAATVGGWTDLGTSPQKSYSRTGVAAQPMGVYIRNGSSGAVGSASEGLLYDQLFDASRGVPPGTTMFTWLAGTLVIFPPSYFNPATTEVRILKDTGTTVRCFDSGSGYLYGHNLTARFYNGICIHPNGSTGTVDFQFVEASYNADDAFDQTGSATLTYTDCNSYSNGQLPLTSGQGDGFSAHNATNMTMLRCKGWYSYSGLRSENHQNEVADQCYFKGNFQDVIRLAQGSGATRGTLTMRNCIIEMTAASGGNGIEVDAPTQGTTSATPIVVLDFLTIVSNGVTASTPNGVLINSGTCTVRDIIVEGPLNCGILQTSTATVDEDYDDFHSCTFTTSGANITSGGHSITSDPLFVSKAASNFALQAGSPCIGAGVAIGGITIDYTGATRANPPSIGAYEA